MVQGLLPPSSTPVERRLAAVGADIERVPVRLRDLKRAATAPAALLPWLAWDRSVDRWDDAWSEAAKRKAIANAFAIHRLKGTIGALRRMVEPLGYSLEVTEWWQTQPEGPRGTFHLRLVVIDGGITEALHVETQRLIDAAKRLSQHLAALEIVCEVRGPLSLCVAAYDGDTLTVYPYQPAPLELRLPLVAGLRDHTIDTMTVYP